MEIVINFSWYFVVPLQLIEDLRVYFSSDADRHEYEIREIEIDSKTRQTLVLAPVWGSEGKGRVYLSTSPENIIMTTRKMFFVFLDQ